MSVCVEYKQISMLDTPAGSKEQCQETWRSENCEQQWWLVNQNY
jgi:hypothetical protein